MPLSTDVTPSPRYRHYKGGTYRFLHEATLEATGELAIVYQCERTGRVWVRTSEDFHSHLIATGEQRFTPISE